MLYLEYTGAFPFIETGGLNERQLTDLYLRHLELGKGRGYFPVFFERESYLPQPLYDIKAVKKASQEMLLMDFDYYEEIGPAASLIYGKHIWPMWWD